MAALAALLAGLAWWGERRFAREDAAAGEHLLARSQPVGWSRNDLEGLPAPAQRYLERVLGPPGEPRRLARAKMTGQIRLRPGSRWQPWRGWQAWSLRPPGFVWSARMRAAPLVAVHARDGLLDGRGGLLVRLWGWLTLARTQPVPELDQGSLQRWLAEAPLYPLALLPGPELRWEAVDHNSARVVARAGQAEVSGVFSFGPDGLPHRFRAEARWRQQPGGAFLATPWRASFGQWREVGGSLIPTQAQAAWILPEGEFAYVRLEIEQMELF
jgi:hypothetical protein